MGVDLLALQDTHFALDHLRLAHAATRRVCWRLYHGRDVPVAAGGWGRSCGVWFLAAPGVLYNLHSLWELPGAGCMQFAGCMRCRWPHGLA